MSEPISATRYWVLRGSFGPGLSVAWASVPVLHQDGPIDGRLVEDPSSFTIGVPEAIGAPPERTTTTVEIDNADGALDPWIVGAERTELEYTEPNFLTFEGQIFRGTVGPDGTCTEEAFTPPLVASGPVDVNRSAGTVALSLAHNDGPMLGAVRKLYTVREVAAGGTETAGDQVVCLFPKAIEAIGGDAGYIWTLLGRQGGDNLDAVAPWIYGPATVPLLRITPSGEYPAVFLAGMTWSKTQFDGTIDWSPSIIGKLRSQYQEFTEADFHRDQPTVPVPAAAFVELPLPDGSKRWAEVALAVQPRKPTHEEEPEKYWWSSVKHNGVEFEISNPGHPASTPARILREIIADHSEAGEACLHIPSWVAAEARQLASMRRACAGAIEADTTIADLVEHIAPLGDMALWTDSDGLLRVSLGGWTLADRDQAKGTLPELFEPDVFPIDDSGAAGWTETIPLDPDDRGAVLTKVSIQFTAEQRELFPINTAMGTAPRRVPLEVESEWSPEGRWINPREAGAVVRAMASRGAYPTRRVRFATHADLPLEPGPGGMLRVSHPWGVTAEPPYHRRLLRLERADVQPAEHAADVTLEDLGPSERIRLGMLDSIENWLAVDPMKPNPSTLTLQTTGAAKSSEDVFSSDMVGATIWAHGAALPENRRSYRIRKVSDGKTAEVDNPPSATEVIPASTPTLVDAAWLVMWTHESKGAGHRPDYIRGARLPDGLLGSSDRGFQFGG